MNAVKPRRDDYYTEDVDCGRCGGAIEDSFSFCPWCGAEIEWDEPDPLYVDRAASTIEGAVRLLGAHIGGGSSVTVEPLYVTENDTYSEEGKAYSPVTVNVSGGGNFGSLQDVVTSNVQPEIGASIDDAKESIYEISSGTNVYIRGVELLHTYIASGLTAVSFARPQYTECDAYVCSVDENYEYASVTLWDGTVSVGSTEQWGDEYATYTLTVPELDFDPETGTGEVLVLYVHS